MKSLLLAAGLICLVLPGWSAEELPRGPFKAVIVPQGPMIDGTLSDPIWGKAPLMRLGQVMGVDKSKLQTTARILFDDKFMYVACVCEEPATGSIKKDFTTGDENVWEDDCIELFISANPAVGYKHIVLNPANTIFDQDCPAKGDMNKSWNAKLNSKVTIEENKCWIATLAISINDLDACVGENLNWTFNCTRTRPGRGDDDTMESSWAVLPIDQFHQPEAFASITGMTIVEKSDGVTRKLEMKAPNAALVASAAPEPLKPQSGGMSDGIMVYHKFDFENGHGEFAASDTKLEVTEEGVSGKALRLSRTEDKGSFSAGLPLKINGSQDLKLIYHCKSNGVPTAGLNISDTVSKDNTTPTGYRWLTTETWTPVLYYIDAFRYNDQKTGWDARINPNTSFNNLVFYGEEKGRKDTWMLLDNFVIYRGNDRSPPSKVKAIKAEPKTDGVHLSWESATDNAAVMLYCVSRSDADGPFKKIAETFVPIYTDLSAPPGDHKYRVLACDFENNIGDWSDALAVTSTALAVAQTPSIEVLERENYRENVLAIARKGASMVNRSMVTCYGDSLTGATSYPLEIQGALHTKRVSAYGYAGMQTSYGKQHAAANFGKDKPFAALILYGTNNKKSADAIDKAMPDLEAIAATAIEMGIIPILGTIPPRGFTDPDSKPEANYNLALIETCKKIKVPCGHLFEEYQKMPDRKKLLASDGVHNFGQGMAASARGWKRALDQIEFVLRDKP